MVDPDVPPPVRSCADRRRGAIVPAVLVVGFGLLAAACAGSGGSVASSSGTEAAPSVTLPSGEATTTSPADPSPAAAALIEVLGRRLDIGVEVARTKWNTKAPIEDLAREAVAIDAIGQAAASVGADAEVARRVLQAQIEASKVVQRSLHDQWAGSGRPPFDTVRDLAVELRPQLDEVTVQLVTALRAAGPLPVLSDRAADEAERALTQRLSGVPRAAEAARTALAPLRA